ncbi:MAG: cytidylate kinase-like family protein [Clostridia bacterium]|nr:cytidylate kinase-like family protein [Clostridia bacterium]MBR6687989.1 cytidylate kinase-like family protein [Clostridia bacterium]
MNVITISREFGSGGRELGKRLAEELGYAYYDSEIITEIAKETNLSEEYISSAVESGWSGFSFHYGRSFHPQFNKIAVDVLTAQTNVLKRLASKANCVIVGRSAAAILDELNPLKIFVCADVEHKIQRCRLKNPADAELSDAEMIRNFKRIDNGRKRLHEQLSNTEWGTSKAYHICVNTSGFEIKTIVPSLAQFAKTWFETR